MNGITPLHVVIAGGGIAAVEAAMALRDLAEERVDITVVAPTHDLELKPMRTAEPFAAGHVHRFPLAVTLARFGAELRHGGLAAVEADSGRIVLDDGSRLSYDALVLAVGARPRAAYEHALTFGADDRTEILNDLLSDLEQGYSRSVAFVVPPGVSWPLPLYEIALMTAAQVWGMGIDDLDMHLVTPEPSPLAIFGTEPSAAVGALLDQAGIAFHGQAYAEVRRGTIDLRPGRGELHAERIVALPVLDGPGIPGVPSAEHGFIPIDEHGRVRGLTGVFAAGDATDFAIKQGGIACQQADAIAEYIAAQAGAPVEPQPFRPVLRGRLLTGRGDRFLRNALHGGAGGGQASDFSLWSPPTKISGKYLSQWLPRLERDEGQAVEVEVPLPGSYARGRAALAIDPLSPVSHAAG